MCIPIDLNRPTRYHPCLDDMQTSFEEMKGFAEDSTEKMTRFHGETLEVMSDLESELPEEDMHSLAEGKIARQ